MFALLLSTAILAASPTAQTPAPGAWGYSESTAQLLEKIDEGALRRPVRTRRPLSIGAEIAFNGLGGTGLNVSYNFTPHWSLDAGGGLGAPGLRFGLRGRFNLLTSNWTPYLGAGVNYLLASDAMQSFGSDSSSDSYRFYVAKSMFASGTLGMSYQGSGGFTFLTGLGWSQLLDDQSNVRFVSRTPGKDDRKKLDLAFGSGPIASMMFGYSF